MKDWEWAEGKGSSSKLQRRGAAKGPSRAQYKRTAVVPSGRRTTYNSCRTRPRGNKKGPRA
eukprot:scaffold31815_cov118-Isochrysis_galbana.AAC.15